MTRHPYFDGRHPRVLAHRGFVPPGAEFTENSIAAVVAALSAGATYIESDCHLTADGHVVLFHDDSVERITGDPRLVAELPLAELERLMADRGGLLTLAAALDGFPDTRWNLDVKADAAAIPVGRLVAAHSRRVLLASFSDRRRRAALEEAKKHASDSPAASAGTTTITRALLAALIGSRRLVARSLRGIDALQIPERQGIVPVLTNRLIRAAHAVGVEVHVWTIDDPERMRSLVERGVDGIVTDRADVALQTLN